MEPVKVYVTKYCLTNGISEETLTSEIKELIHTKESGYCCYFLDKEAFLNWNEAVKDANKRKEAKLKSLRKSIDKLEKLTFE
jgi:uncharacterized protein (DUF2164 family)